MNDIGAGKSGFSVVPLQGSGSKLSVNPSGSADFSMKRSPTMLKNADKDLKAALLFLLLLHVCCGALFVFNIFAPAYNLEEDDGAARVGSVSLNNLNVHCDPCSDSQKIFGGESYLTICGFSEDNKEGTEGFVSMFLTGFACNFVAVIVSFVNIVLCITYFCTIRKEPGPANDCTRHSVKLLMISVVLSLIELAMAVAVACVTQLGSWDRQAVADMFNISAFQCDEVWPKSDYGFLTYWVAVGLTAADILAVQKVYASLKRYIRSHGTNNVPKSYMNLQMGSRTS